MLSSPVLPRFAGVAGVGVIGDRVSCDVVEADLATEPAAIEGAAPPEHREDAPRSCALLPTAAPLRVDEAGRRESAIAVAGGARRSALGGFGRPVSVPATQPGSGGGGWGSGPLGRKRWCSGGRLRMRVLAHRGFRSGRMSRVGGSERVGDGRGRWPAGLRRSAGAGPCDPARQWRSGWGSGPLGRKCWCSGGRCERTFLPTAAPLGADESDTRAPSEPVIAVAGGPPVCADRLVSVPATRPNPAAAGRMWPRPSLRSELAGMRRAASVSRPTRRRGAAGHGAIRAKSGPVFGRRGLWVGALASVLRNDFGDPIAA
jgi:hypothetical protein